MGYQMITLLLVALFSQVYTAPQFITFKDGKLGVNFGGYHAGVGIGGLVGGTGSAGGLYAEAGTPTGQNARAGLGGSVDERGGASGALYAGARAAPNVKASAGLSGGVNGQTSVGGGLAAARAGDNFASSALAGQSSIHGSIGATHTIEVKPSVETQVKIDSTNEVQPVDFLPLNNGGSNIKTKVNIEGDAQPPVVVKEVYVEPRPVVVEKHIIHTHYKPRRHHFHKTAFIGGYLGGGGEVVPSTVLEVKPVVHKRIDVSAAANANAGAAVGANAYGGAGHTYTKQVTYHNNPTFFDDIFNIPISTLHAVRNLLDNAAVNTNVSVQKSASLQAGAYL